LAATRTAARVGHVLAWALIALGLLLALVNLVSGLWLVLIGWFLDNAGRAEATAVAEQSTLGSLPVARLMSPAPVTVARDITVDDLVHGYVLGRHHSAFPVVGEAGHPVGLVSLDQVRQVPPERRSSLTVGEIAEPLPRVPVVGPGDTGADVLDRMRSAGASRALVIDDQGRLVGIVSHSDLVRALQVTVPPPPLPPSSRDR
ncbi:MAG: CBS domain-containing protein, partial [Acidimicrobiales bacterium]